MKGFALFFVLLSLPLASAHYEPFDPQTATIELLSRQAGVAFYAFSSAPNLAYSPLPISSQEARFHLAAIEKAFQSLPQRLLLKMDLRVILTRGFGYSLFGNFKLEAFTELDGKTIFLNSQYPQLVNHEFFHALEFQFDGESFFRNWQTVYQKLEPRNDAPAGSSRDDLHAGDGYVSQYAKSSEWEDRAEIFVWMREYPQRLRKLCEIDKVLAEKVRRMNLFLQRVEPRLMYR